MTTGTLYPFLFKPVYKDYIWGGAWIPRHYGRPGCPPLCAESWELSEHPDGMSVVSNGALAGSDLRRIVQSAPAAILGSACAADRFPLLIKLIDARDRLSVQVHPNESTAAKTRGEPKTEMWYVLDSEPGAALYVGLKRGVTEADFRRALEQRTVEGLLNRVPVSAGDVVYVPGGRVHAIGAKCRILEVQQNSNTTYRVYDWDRMGADGKPRELHIEQALATINWQDEGAAVFPAASGQPVATDAFGLQRRERLCSPFFRFESVTLAAAVTIKPDGKTFHALFVECGMLRIESEGVLLDMGPGTTTLIPASLPSYRLLPKTPPVQLIRVTLPTNG